MSKWAKWLKENAPPYPVHISNFPVVEYINKLDSLGNSFIDWGSGMGYIATAVANKGNNVQAYDHDTELLQVALDTKSDNILSTAGKLTFSNALDDLKPADVVYTDGLLEHYGNDDIIKLLHQQMKYAKQAVAFCVPSDMYPYKGNIFGDERLLSIKEWEAMLQPEFGDCLTQLYYGKRKIYLFGVLRGWKKTKTKVKKSETIS